MDLKIILKRAHHLFVILASKDYIFDKTAFVEAYNIIASDFVNDFAICSIGITGIQNTIVKNIFSKITAATGDYDIRQVLLMFCYVFILFDAIFNQEAIASASQLVPERSTKKSDSYLELTHRNEKMRNTLLELILYKDYQSDDPDIMTFGIDDEIINAITLMLAACEKCYQHINGNYVDSEYINRAAFSAILRSLEKTFETIGLELPEKEFFEELYDMNTTRFGIYYNKLKAIFNSLNPPRQRRNKEQEYFIAGCITGLNCK